MRFVLGFFGLSVLALIFVFVLGPKTPGAAPSPSLDEQKRAVLDYTACEGGMTVERATTAGLRASRAQEIGTIRYVWHDARMWKFAIPYKAENGAERTVSFNYAPATGKVNAEDDTALAILRLMESGCR